MLEKAITDLISTLSQKGFHSLKDNEINWDTFIALSDHIHSEFTVPATSITPIMRRFLFGIANCAQPEIIAGIGTYHGYAISWLLGCQHPKSQFKSAYLFDPDTSAMEMCKTNIQTMGFNDEMIQYIPKQVQESIGCINKPIDILYIDLDNPINGKHEYTDVLQLILPLLRPGALILAHDALVTKFKKDFERYHTFLESSNQISCHRTLKIDEYGISIAMKGGLS